MDTVPVINAKILLNYLSECNLNYNPDVRQRLKAQEQRSKIVSIISSIKETLKNDSADSLIFITEFLKRIWHLEIVWFVSLLQIVDLVDYLHKWKENVELGEELLNIFAISNTGFKKDMKRDILQVLCNANLQDARIVDSFTKGCYDMLKNNLDDGDVPIFEVLDGLELSKQSIILSKIIKISLFDMGQKSFDAMGSSVLYKHNTSPDIKNIFQKFVDSFTNKEELGNFLYDFLTNCTSDSLVNWSNICLLTHNFKCQSLIKTVVNKLIEYSLIESSSWHLYAVFLLGRIISLKSSGLKITYLQWFSSTFSSDSYRPINTISKAQFFLKCMTDVLYVEPPCYLKVHINKVVSIPSGCQTELSEYLHQAKVCLASLNESSEIGIFDISGELGAGENDAKCLVDSFKSSGKISQHFLTALTFRRAYFEREILPRLMASCKGQNSCEHAVIKILASKGKIGKGAFAKHLESCGRKS